MDYGYSFPTYCKTCNSCFFLFAVIFWTHLQPTSSICVGRILRHACLCMSLWGLTFVHLILFEHYLVTFFNQFSYTNFLGCFWPPVKLLLPTLFVPLHIPTNGSPLSNNTIWVCAMDCTYLSKIIWIFIAFCTYSIKMNSELKVFMILIRSIVSINSKQINKDENY